MAASRRIPFSSVVMVLSFRLGIPSSNPVQNLYFCHAFIHLFLCYGLRKSTQSSNTTCVDICYLQEMICVDLRYLYGNDMSTSTLSSDMGSGVCINSMPNDKMFDMPKFKAFADDKLNFANMMLSVCYRL